MGRAEVATAGLGDRPETRLGRIPGDHDTDGAAPLALDALAVSGNVGTTVIQKRADQFDQLAFVDGAAA
jgi:hypothetical protein